MDIIELIQYIKSPTEREYNNACGELIRRTSDWKNPTVRLSNSIFTQICHKYYVNTSPTSISDIESIYYESMSRIIINIRNGKLDQIKSQNNFEAYSKMICANVCKEWLKDFRSKGITWAPLYTSYKDICLVKQGEDFLRVDSRLKVFRDIPHAREYFKNKKDYEIIPVDCINDEDLLYEINLDTKEFYYETFPEDVFKENDCSILTYSQIKRIENEFGIHKSKISSCRLIFEICYSTLHGGIEEEYAEWISVPGNESASIASYKTKKSRCFSKLRESIKNSKEFKKAKGSVDDYLDLLFGNTSFGCTDPNALNFNPIATLDDNSCIYEV